MSDDFTTRSRACRRGRGFTLVELMITLAIAAILLMIAVPSFQRLILSNRLTTSANALVDAINTARLDAIKLNATTQFCGNTAATNNPLGDTLGAACGTQAGAVFALPQSATSANEVRAAVPGLTSPVQVTAMSAVRFSGQGFGYAPSGTSDTPYTGPVATISVPQSQLPSNNQRLVCMTAGSVVAVVDATGTSAGTCP